MNTPPDPLRAQLVRLLDWEEAHVGFDKAVADIPTDRRGAQPQGFEHSPWQLLEHMRIAQKDILDFSVSRTYEHNMTWPDDYWPKNPAPPEAVAWDDSIADFKADREKLKALACDETIDVLTRVPTGEVQQTVLRGILLAADHTAYHVGQLVAVRRALGIWE